MTPLQADAMNMRIDVTTSSAATAISTDFIKAQNVCISNLGDFDAFFVLGGSSVAAVLPVVGTPQKGIYVPAGKSMSFTNYKNDGNYTHIAAIGTGSVTCIVTLGAGA